MPRKEPQLPEAINLSTFDPDEEVKRLAAEGRWSELRARSEWQRECREFYRYGYLEGVRAAQETARGKLPALEDWASVDLKRMGRTGRQPAPLPQAAGRLLLEGTAQGG